MSISYALNRTLLSIKYDGDIFLSGYILYMPFNINAFSPHNFYPSPKHTILILYYPSYVVCLNHLFNISFHSSSYSLHIQSQHKKSKILIQGRLGLGILLLSNLYLYQIYLYTSLAVFHLVSDLSLRRQSHPPIIFCCYTNKIIFAIYLYTLTTM